MMMTWRNETQKTVAPILEQNGNVPVKKHNTIVTASTTPPVHVTDVFFCSLSQRTSSNTTLIRVIELILHKF